MADQVLTEKQIQEKINRFTSDMIRHDGNVLELTNQLKQLQAEINYEKGASEKCMQELEILHSLLQPIQEN